MNFLISITRKQVAAALAVAALAAGVATVRAQAETAPATQAAAATRPSFGPVTAVINNENLSREDFQAALEAVAGMRIFDQILSLVVAQQACQTAGEVVGPEQVKAMRDRVLQGLRDQGVPENQLDQALAQVIQRQGITPFEFDLTLRRNAYIAALSKGKVTITQEQVDQAFKIETGNRYVIIDTLLQDPAMASELRKLIEKEKKSIADAGAQLRVRQERITISEFADEKQVPKSILDQSKKLKTGELSVMIPLENGTHMLYMENIIPPKEFKAAEIASHKEKLKAQLQQQLEDQWGQEHLRMLVSKARVDIKDPVILGMYQQLEAYRAQQAAAATQAAATAPAPK